MRADLVISYRHNPATGEPHFVGPAHAENIAQHFRHQLGYDDGVLVPDLERLTEVKAVWVNGIAYELEWSTDGPVSDEGGKPVWGLCEFHPDLPDSAQISVNPELVGDFEELVRSTTFHETGHGIFEAPAWIHAHRKGSAPGLFDQENPRRAQQARRTITPNEEHLAVAARRGSPEFFQEVRTNEFMGSSLAPRSAVTRQFLKHCGTAGLDPSLVAPCSPQPLLHEHVPPQQTKPAGNLRFLRLDLMLRLRDVVAKLARDFLLTRRFIEVRLKRYGLLHQAIRVR